MSGKHTSGPWEVSSIQGEVAVIGAGNGFYADVVANICNHTERDANAALIAAAPDLLAALHGLAKLAWQEGYTVFQPEVKAAQDAIAKATGAA